MTDKLLNCISIKDVEKEFKNISKQGCLMSVTSTVDAYYGGHAQGSNYYVDKNGKKYFIVSDDDQDEKDHGYLIIFKESPSEVKPIIIDTPSGFNHPGSFQIVGDYLFLPVENYDEIGSNSDIKSMVCVYDLSPLASGGKPKLLDGTKNTFKDHKAGMLGVTDEWLAIHDNSNFYLYKIVSFKKNEKKENDIILELKSYNSKGTCKLESFQAIGLVKSADGALYLIGLCSDWIGNTFKDSLVLYRINTDSSDCSFEAVKKANHDATTDQGNGIGGLTGIHFRFGGGVYIYSSNNSGHITCLGTGRQIQKGSRFNYNHFSSVDTLEVISRHKPLENEKGRSSGNFSMKGFRKSMVKFTVYNNGSEDKNVVFQIYKDVPIWSDEQVYKNVKSGDIRHGSKESPIYIHTPSPESTANIKIVMESVAK